MTLEASLLMTTRLLSFTMLVQAIEIYVLSRQQNFHHIWSYKNLRLDLEKGLPFNKGLIEKIFSIKGLKTTTIVQISLATVTAIHPNPVILALLFLTHLLICIRFRGAFNGGSDMMTFVVLTGLIIATAGFGKIGLIYIATHTIYSYFKAGIAKATHKEWWTGKAIPAFLSRSIFPDIQALGTKIKHSTALTMTLGIGTIIFELLAIGLLFTPNTSYLYFALALVFHLSIYFTFGLNRFFWIWLTAWPATLYSLSLLA